MLKKKSVWEKLLPIEKFIDKSVPVLVIALAILIILDFSIDLEHYQPWIGIFDGFIVTFFIIDLVFKWRRTKTAWKFIKSYWIDIIAVFPFYLIFRTVILTASFARLGEETQRFLHEAILVSAEMREARLLEEMNLLKKETKLLREIKFGRGIRLVQRFFRFMKGRLYYAHCHLFKAHKQLEMHGLRKKF